MSAINKISQKDLLLAADKSKGQCYAFLRFFGVVNSSGVGGIGSQSILSSTISSRAMSATPMVGGTSINGRLPVPPAELSWRTRRDIRFTRMLGLPTFSSAFLLRSAFKFLFQWVKRT